MESYKLAHLIENKIIKLSMSPISFDAHVSYTWKFPEVIPVQMRAIDKWAKKSLGFVCKRWFNIVHQNIFTESIYPTYDYRLNSLPLFPIFKHLIQILKKDKEIPKINQSTQTIEIDNEMKRIYSILFDYVFCSSEYQVRELIENLSDYPHLQRIWFRTSGKKSLDFLYLFLRIAGEIYLNDRSKFPSLKTIAISLQREVGNVLNEMIKYEFLGIENLEITYAPTDVMHYTLKSPVHTSIKSIYITKSELVDWTIQSFPNLTFLKIHFCKISIGQFIAILSTLNRLQNLQLVVEDSTTKWDIVYNENRDLVKNLLDLLKSNQTITSLTLDANEKGLTLCNILKIILDEIFIFNKTITKLNLGYLKASQFTDKFYQSLYDSSVTKLSIRIQSDIKMKKFYEIIKSPHCNIQSLKVYCYSFHPIKLLESMEYNLSIKYLTIITHSCEPIRLKYNHSLQRFIFGKYLFSYSYDSSCLVEFYPNFLFSLKIN
ncbi:hypothetical protein DLAC_02871 [Tieghemostelium lacteum]|uniref:F-box domain-containing protein n=1 Tax=Tieghemostelium lacteum TaxID=361077 RepID=A0A152A3M7_TIELA|nr:hypothetical protein DLAC_02871 [Tieghemostelium lacteum]|eukprot:KYR00820.1 hypothetical protein DLAC_02871 [Tieghemostelium lacteum]